MLYYQPVEFGNKRKAEKRAGIWPSHLPLYHVIYRFLGNIVGGHSDTIVATGSPNFIPMEVRDPGIL